jgi:hypothetical protein
MGSFHDTYQREVGPYAWHITPVENLASIVMGGLDPAARPVSYGIGGSREGCIFLSTREPKTPPGWACLRVHIRSLDPQHVAPDDDAYGLLGFFERFDNADELLDSWGVHELGAWVAERALEMDSDENLAVLMTAGDFAYQRAVDASQLQLRTGPHRWSSLCCFTQAAAPVTPGAAGLHWQLQRERLINLRPQAVTNLAVVDGPEGVDMERLTDGDYARGRCAAVAHALAQHLQACGLIAGVAWGNDPHTGSGDAHQWVECIGEDGRRWMIDLTASQFGMQTWPLVREITLDAQRLGEELANGQALPASGR